MTTIPTSDDTFVRTLDASPAMSSPAPRAARARYQLNDLKRAWVDLRGRRKGKTPPRQRALYALAFHREAGVGIEPAYTALQAAA